MDRRKVVDYRKSVEEAENYEANIFSDQQRLQQVINSSKVNEALLNNVDAMFNIEFNIKQKAQLKYLQVKTQRKSKRFQTLNFLSHEFLWTPTPIYYLFTAATFMLVKKRLRLTLVHSIPFLAIPATMDYVKRDYYASMFKKERQELK
jgi:hypothetical protein